MTSEVIIRILIVFLSVVGLANALYFTFAYYGRIKKARWVPEILCAREGSSCVTVVQTPYARVFGVPNSLLGIIYYVLLIVWACSGFTIGPSITIRTRAVPLSILGFLAAGAGTVVLGFYLIYALRRKLHTHCPLCYLGHAINGTLFILLMALIDWYPSL
ncbi:MAG TPA: vitamin K epoxide reductase family protein [Terriglobia bacterium]|nr:vitamin K epoxide reductase family protein [Terriglobia bacterium]